MDLKIKPSPAIGWLVQLITIPYPPLACNSGISEFALKIQTWAEKMQSQFKLREHVQHCVIVWSTKQSWLIIVSFSFPPSPSPVVSHRSAAASKVFLPKPVPCPRCSLIVLDSSP
jgi:hypothetical protein